MLPATNQMTPVGAALPMLPDDPILRGRLFQAARTLLGWTRARVAGEAGVSTGAVDAVEIGRRGVRAPPVPLLMGALKRAGVRLAAGPTDDGSCVVHTIHRVVPRSFLPCRVGMATPPTTSCDELLFVLRLALREVPPGVWRNLAKRRPAATELDERIAAEAILAHLELAGVELRYKPLPSGLGPSVSPRA